MIDCTKDTVCRWTESRHLGKYYGIEGSENANCWFDVDD